ncbi:MAG: hypothetical protein JKY96_08465, partial [Phycisphaerales bacterium]|nr:hypothetical protein [Phycisphaerales bacterium]
MDDLDTKIRNALNSENTKLLGDPNDGHRLDQLVLSVFKSNNRFITALMMVMTFVFLGIAIWCVVQFFGTDNTKELIAFASGFLTCMMALSMMKIWFWMEMQRHMM